MTHLKVVVLSDSAMRALAGTKPVLPNPLTKAARTVELAMTLRYLKKHPAHRLSRALATWTAPSGAIQRGRAAELSGLPDHGENHRDA